MSHQGRLPSVLEKPVGLKFHGDLNGRHALNELQFFGQGFFGAHRGGGQRLEVGDCHLVPIHRGTAKV
jgi:hypothetical protein